jgi:hypothetical protein
MDVHALNIVFLAFRDFNFSVSFIKSCNSSCWHPLPYKQYWWEVTHDWFLWLLLLLLLLLKNEYMQKMEWNWMLQLKVHSFQVVLSFSLFLTFFLFFFLSILRFSVSVFICRRSIQSTVSWTNEHLQILHYLCSLYFTTNTQLSDLFQVHVIGV